MGFESGFELRSTKNSRLVSGGLFFGYLGRCTDDFDRYIIKHAELNKEAYDCDDNTFENEDVEYVISKNNLKFMVAELSKFYNALTEFSDRELNDITDYESGSDCISKKEYETYMIRLAKVKDAMFDLNFSYRDYINYKWCIETLNNICRLGVLDDNTNVMLVYWRSY